jgi:hypothetical protein
VLSSMASKAHGRSSWRGMDGECTYRLHLVEDSATALLHASCTRRCSQQRCTATFLLRFQGQMPGRGKKSLGRRARGRRKKREPGRGHYDKDRPAIIAWVSRQGAVVIQATRDFTVKTVQKAADLAVQAGSRLSTDSASSYRAVKGYLMNTSITPRKSTHGVTCMRIEPSACFPYSSPTCGCFVASAKRPCRGTAWHKMQMIAGFFWLGRSCCTARAWSNFLPLLQEVSSICKTRNQLHESLWIGYPGITLEVRKGQKSSLG